MSDRRELHERISESIEPRASLAFRDSIIGPSPLRCWYVEDYWHPQWIAWRWDTDESASALLLEAMLDAGCSISLDRNQLLVYGPRQEEHEGTRVLLYQGVGSDRKSLTTDAYDAYAKWKQLA